LTAYDLSIDTLDMHVCSPIRCFILHGPNTLPGSHRFFPSL
jgi:hypothetical protein